jgi:hypothetical protein
VNNFHGANVNETASHDSSICDLEYCCRLEKRACTSHSRGPAWMTDFTGIERAYSMEIRACTLVPSTDNRAALRDFAAVLFIERAIAAERRKGSALCRPFYFRVHSRSFTF